MKKIFCFALLVFFTPVLFASHIVGGEMYYHYIGNNQYEITLVVYRDCINGQAPYDSPASLGVFDSQGNLVDNVLVPIHDTSFVPNAINTPCLTPPLDICDQVAHYYTTVTLPPAPGGYTIAYQRCCRNYSCLNIFQFTGATYTAQIPDQLYAADDNPVYNNLPPTFICAGAPFTFDHSATDADGDQLVYSMYTPYDGADQANPQPSPPSSPPYTPIVFQPPYSLANVMGGVPMTIDPQTGLLTATPSTIGQYVYGILVQEYRNGVLIGETRRDFQVNVTFCANYTVASIFSPTLVCGSLNASFLNTSYGAATYSWSFGDPTTTNDTSTLQNPSYLYPDTGTYPLTLVAYAANPNCNDTAFGEARVYPAFFSRFGTISQHCSNQFQFLDSSFSLNSSANFWLWNFGDNQISNAQNPAHQYASWGNYTVTLIASADSGCTDTAVVNVEVDPVPVSSFSLDLDTCAHVVSFHNSSQLASIYYWIFGDSNISDEENPQHNYQIDGNVTAYLVTANDSGCIDTTQLTFNLPPVPVALFTLELAQCDSVVHLHNLSLNAPNYSWDFGDNAVSSASDPVHLYEHSGQYTVTLNADNTACADQFTQTVNVARKPTASFSLALDTCSFLVHSTNNSSDATIYVWNFSDGFSDQSAVTQHQFQADGNVSVRLIALNDSGCSDTAFIPASIPPLPKSDFAWTHTDCDSLVTFVGHSTNTVAYRWLFGDGETNEDAQAEHIYHIAGDIPVKLISTSQFGCRDTADKSIHIVVRTPAAFEYFLDSCAGEVYFSNRSPIAVHYDWNFGDQGASTEKNPVHVYSTNNADFIVTLTVNKESSCQEYIQKTLRYEKNEGEILYVPNSFTPNGDGLNDLFELSLWKPCDTYSITIFDRWGHAVYRNDDAHATSWDGTFSGHSVPEDVYVYVLEGANIKKTGYVLLMK
jgi:gliding motility-associated-like protein